MPHFFHTRVSDLDYMCSQTAPPTGSPNDLEGGLVWRHDGLGVGAERDLLKVDGGAAEWQSRRRLQ